MTNMTANDNPTRRNPFAGTLDQENIDPVVHREGMVFTANKSSPEQPVKQPSEVEFPGFSAPVLDEPPTPSCFGIRPRQCSFDDAFLEEYYMAVEASMRALIE